MDLQVRFAPRDWQMVALNHWLDNELSGIVKVVTGGGKTAFAFFAIVEFLRLFPDGKIFIVVPTTALLDQWHVSLQEDLGVAVESIASFSGDEKPESPCTINIAVINTARSMSIDLSKGSPTFIIVDECHRAGSPANAKALRGEFKASLGLSATPEREYDRGFEDFVEPALGPIIFDYDYEQAFRDGVISPFDLVNVQIDLLTEEQKRYDALNKRIAIELSRLHDSEQSEQLKRLLHRRAQIANLAAMRIPVAAKLVEMNRGRRALVFHEYIEAANRLARILRERNHSATLYHSRIGPTIRRENLRLYRKGIFDVLVTCRALDEGFNVPETEIAVIASSTSSSRQRIQRLGRVLRPSRNKQSAKIYTLYATDAEQDRLLQEARSLREISTITWAKGTRTQDGKDSTR